MSSNVIHVDFRMDLRDYSGDELSLWVFNEESLYNMRHNCRQQLRSVLEEKFNFTDEQWDELVQNLEEDEENV